MSKNDKTNQEIKLNEQQKQAVKVLFEIAELAQSSGVIKTTEVASMVYSAKLELSRFI